MQRFPLSRIVWFRKSSATFIILHIYFRVVGSSVVNSTLDTDTRIVCEMLPRKRHNLTLQAMMSSRWDCFNQRLATVATLSFWRSKPWSRKHSERLSTFATWSGLCTQIRVNGVFRLYDFCMIFIGFRLYISLFISFTIELIRSLQSLLDIQDIWDTTTHYDAAILQTPVWWCKSTSNDFPRSPSL